MASDFFNISLSYVKIQNVLILEETLQMLPYAYRAYTDRSACKDQVTCL